MSVGDLKNNLRKLQTSLRSIKYEKDIDFDSLSKGAVGSFLPIYHFLFLDYSHPIAQQITDLNIELSGKTDLRFCEAMYKVLRELFSYKPPITKDQLFANGFVERKVIMCTEIIQLVRDKDRSLAPKASRPRSTASSAKAAKLGPRQLDSSTGGRNKENIPAGPPNHMPAPVQLKPPKGSTSSSTSETVPVQVVNEIRNTVASSIRSAFTPEGVESPPNPPVLDSRPISMDSGLISSERSAVVKSSKTVSTARDPSFVSMEAVDLRGSPPAVEPLVIREDQPPKPRPTAAWEGMRAVVVTHGEKQPQQPQGSGYNPSRYEAEAEPEEDESRFNTYFEDADDSFLSAQPPTFQPPRPIDMIAMTPARPPQVTSMAPPQQPPRPIDMIAMTPARPPQASSVFPAQQNTATAALRPVSPTSRITDTLQQLEKSVREFGSRIMGLESRLGVVENLLSMQNEKERESQAADKQASAMSAIQLETLLARMTLVENKLALVESQGVTERSARPHTSIQTQQPEMNGHVHSHGQPKKASWEKAAPRLHVGLSPIVSNTAAPEVHDNAEPLPETPVLSAGSMPSDDFNRRMSSTPVEFSKPSREETATDPQKASTENGKETLAQAERIKNLLKSTEQLLQIEVKSPVKAQPVM